MKGNGKILVCCPSRGRSVVASEMLDSFRRTVSAEGIADIVIRVGEKDPTAHEYHKLQGNPAIVYWGTDDGFGWPTAAYCLAIEDIRKRFPGYSYYMMLEDDCTFESLHWDLWIVDQYKQFPNRIGLIRLVDASMQIHALVASAETIEVLGFFQVPELREQSFSGLIDIGAAAEAIVEGTGCVIRHTPVDPSRGRGGFIYTGYSDTRAHWAEDCAALERWRVDTLPALAEKLKKARAE